MHLVTVPPSQKQMTIMCKAIQQKAVHTLVTLLISISSGSNKEIQEWICLFCWQHSHKNRFKSALKLCWIIFYTMTYICVYTVMIWVQPAHLVHYRYCEKLRIQVCLYVSRSEWFLMFWSHCNRSKCREPLTRRNSIAHQKTWTLSNSSVRTSDHARYIFDFTMTTVWCTCV